MADENATSPEEAPGKKASVAQKVELDLDDAPFLEEDEPEEEPQPQEPAPVEEAPPAPVEETPPPKSKKKLIIIAAAASVLLIAAFVFVNFFLFGEKKPEPEPAPKPEPEVVVVEPKKAPAPEPSTFIIEWEPFWVEVKDTEGAIHFLTCRFDIPTDSPILSAELQAKKLILRDAVYYYLKNQPTISLNDPERVGAFKEEIMSVMNEHLGAGKIAELLIQDYLVR